jgi:hypothetical protein
VFHRLDGGHPGRPEDVAFRHGVRFDRRRRARLDGQSAGRDRPPVDARFVADVDHRYPVAVDVRELAHGSPKRSETQTSFP